MISVILSNKYDLQEIINYGSTLQSNKVNCYISSVLSIQLRTLLGDGDIEENQPKDNLAYLDVEDDVSVQPVSEFSSDNQLAADSQSTITLSHPSQDPFMDSEELFEQQEKEFEDKECQTNDGMFLSNADYKDLMNKAQGYCNFQEELTAIRLSLSSGSYTPEMDPDAFESFCRQVGAEKLFLTVYDGMISSRMSENRRKLNKTRTMVIIYMMLYGQSQRCNWFQVALSRTLQQFGITERGLASLMNLGIAAHPHTVKASAKLSASSHTTNLASFFENIVAKKQFLAIFIDDYHNIHTKHRPESKTQTQAIHMATLLVKVFPNVAAIPKVQDQPLLSELPVQIDTMSKILLENLQSLSKTYAQNMPDWVVAKYFDPEAQRHRLAVHDYQQTEIRQMRCMDNCKLVDSVEMPLKSADDILAAFKHMLSSGLSKYLDHFIAPFVGDWPTQFYMRKIAYSDGDDSAASKSIASFIGPLHISINSRECVLMLFHKIFADLYSFLFGKKAKLARKPQPWRISLLLEIIYGGWTLIRDMVLSVFSQCKDVQYLTLLNLLDNYAPLVLSIYSIVFKCNDLELYCQSVLRCWVMLMVFGRRHYDKALLVALSMFRYWKDHGHPFHDTLATSLAAFDEYPVENFHSVLRARTKEGNTAEQISLRAKEIDACKHELHNFKSWFVPPKKFNFSSKRINSLKVKAAKFLTTKFQMIITNPGAATVLPRAPRQRKVVTKWKLPDLFDDEVVTNKVLPLGFTSLENPPDPEK